MYHPPNPSEAQDPFAGLAELRRHCPVAVLTDPAYPPLGLVTRYDDATTVYREHMFVCMVTDDTALSQIDLIGENNLMWESDFPHTDGMWPHSRSTLVRSLADIDDDVAVKIGSTNAQRVFGVVPSVVAPGLGPAE